MKAEVRDVTAAELTDAELKEIIDAGREAHANRMVNAAIAKRKAEEKAEQEARKNIVMLMALEHKAATKQ